MFIKQAILNSNCFLSLTTCNFTLCKCFCFTLCLFISTVSLSDGATGTKVLQKSCKLSCFKKILALIFVGYQMYSALLNCVAFCRLLTLQPQLKYAFMCLSPLWCQFIFVFVLSSFTILHLASTSSVLLSQPSVSTC